MSNEINEYFRRAWMRLLERIEEKTSWGKNELKNLMLECLIKDSPECEDVKEAVPSQGTVSK